MNNEMVKSQMRELCQAPGPERKEEFFRQLKAQGLLGRRTRTLSQVEFVAGQIPYIEKWTWVLSVLLLVIT